MDKEDVVHTYNGILLSHKENKIMPFVANGISKWHVANGSRDHHTTWSKSERERQIPYDITYMWNLKYDTNELIWQNRNSKI